RVPSPIADSDELEEEDEKEIWTIFHQTESYLSKNYDIRFNSISLEHELSIKNENDFQSLNENDLFVELNKKGIRIGMDKLIAILKSNYVAKFNPVKVYFDSLPDWDQKTDHIGNLISHLHAHEQDAMNIQFKKWMVRAVRCALAEGYN